MLSVIVPVYQAVLTLDRCVSSILEQCVDDMEIILVDDGSDDGSSELCDSIAKENENVVVMHIKNSGPYQARRQGVLMAGGDVITFVDADDWIEKGAYAKLLKLYRDNKVDILLYAQQYSVDGNNNLHGYVDGLYKKSDIQKIIIPSMIWNCKLGRGMIEPSLCSKFIKKELFLAVTDDVTERLVWGDDAAVTYPMMTLADSIYIYNATYYHYCITENSNTRNYPISRVEELKNFRKVITKKLLTYPQVDFRWQIDCYMRMFLDMLSVGWFGCHRVSQLYTFPFRSIQAGSKIKLYGAGDVGKSFYLTIKQYGDMELTGWYDKKAKKIREVYGEAVKDVDELSIDDNEILLIAVKNEKIADSIRCELVEKNIANDRIIWEEPFLMG